MSLPWCENCQAEVEAETNESNGFTCVPFRRTKFPVHFSRSLLTASRPSPPHNVSPPLSPPTFNFCCMKRFFLVILFFQRALRPHLPSVPTSHTKTKTDAAPSAVRFSTTMFSPPTPRSPRRPAVPAR